MRSYVFPPMKQVARSGHTMTEHTYVGAIDQGTTGTRFVIFDHDGQAVASAYETHEQHYPEPGWVEHDPRELWDRTKAVVRGALDSAEIEADQLAAIGVTNQRETTILWDAETGEPIHNAIVWQDRRTTDRVEELEAEGMAQEIRTKTGLAVDAYFSATKIEWLLDHADNAASPGTRERAQAGEILFGTVDSWLVYNLTGEHVTDVTNASRTMLFDIHDLTWDDDLLGTFGIPEAMLPDVRPSSAHYGETDSDGFLGAAVPVCSALGDQQAALFGQACFEAGDAKNTYGTGSFLLLNTGQQAVESDHGLLTTVGFQRAGEPVQYALEGSMFVTGAAVEWLVDLGLVENAAETAELALSTDSTDDVYFVPAFAGLGAPYWDGRARGTIVGMTRGTRREHLVRAVLESIAYRTRDVVEAMEADSGVEITRLLVDGGVVENDALCQIQADVLCRSIVRPTVTETTALGAAYAAGLATGYWEDLDEIRDNRQVEQTFESEIAVQSASNRYERWTEAVERSRDWARE